MGSNQLNNKTEEQLKANMELYSTSLVIKKCK